MSAVNKSTCEVAIAGGGPAGLLCALLLHHKGVKPVLISKPAPKQIGRTVALMEGSLQLLKTAGVYDQVAKAGEPLRAIRLVDDTGGFFRAPTTVFDAHELGLEAFGLNIPNDALQAALDVAVRSCDIERIEGAITSADLQDKHVIIHGDDFACTADVVVAADGRRSILREALGLKTKKHSYPQSAVTAIFEHAAPHHGVSTEFHTRHGPFTLVPLQGNKSSLVAVVAPDDAEHLVHLPDDLFCRDVERRCQHLLGKMSLISQRGTWPLEMAVPQQFAVQRVLLAGEAAHVLPPIGAQGLNLGLRDAEAAAENIASAIFSKSDPGSADVMKLYNDNRARDIRPRSFAVDSFNRSLLTPFLPAHLLRGFGLYLANSNNALRKGLIRTGLG
ncbi:MAG: FAD-dependent monooxygenase [Pseudomonadota bacterium]